MKMLQNQDIYYFNALFDLELGGYPMERDRAGALEMSSLFSFCGTGRDRFLLDIAIRDEHWTYLKKNCIPHALPFYTTDTPTDFNGIAWGWNKKSAERFQALGVHCKHPELSVIRTVNGREFCAKFNAETATGVPGSRFCKSAEDIRFAVHALKNNFPFVIKPTFGDPGFGFIIINSPDEMDGEPGRKIDRLIAQNGCVVEPWCERVYDVSSSCVLKSDGSIDSLRHYRCYTGKRGTFYGVVFGGTNPIIEQHREKLEQAVRHACRALTREGYFGPVSFDSLVFKDNKSGHLMLAPVIEINARYTMSFIAHALYSSIGCDRCCFFRFINRRLLSLPETYSAWEEYCGADCYSPEKRKGIITLSPLRVSHSAQWIQPSRSAFLIVASSEDEMVAMDARLRRTSNNYADDTVSRLKKTGIMAIPSSLAALNTISLADQSAFIDAVEVRKQTSWLYYFPFLFCFAIARRQTVLWERIDGSICLYFLRERDDGFRLDLYLPPFPFSVSALKRAQERANDFNRNRSCRIFYLEEMDRPFVEAAGYSTTFRENEEFIYDTKLAVAAEGKSFERLRRNINQTRKIPDIEIRAFQERDTEACRELLDRWRSRMRDDLGIEISGYHYTRNSIAHALSFSNDVMKGEVILIGDKLSAFTFGGQVTQELGSIFVTISDRDIKGLGYFQRHSFLSNNAGLAYFNDGSADRQGLSHVKTAFRPITMNKLYRARQMKNRNQASGSKLNQNL
jgi:hypothetical protein